MAVRMEDRKVEAEQDAIGRAVLMTVRLVEEEHIKVPEAVERLWKRFRLSHEDIVRAAKMGIARQGHGLMTARRGVGSGEDVGDSGSAFEKLYLSPDGIYKPLGDFTVEDLEWYESEMRKEAAGFAKKANWASVARKMCIERKVRTPYGLPEVDKQRLEEMWKK